MLRDHIGGEAVNLIPSDKPQDIYQRVADVVVEKLRSSSTLLAQQWLAFGIDRAITKRPVMILPYGGTRHACREYIEDHIRERLSKGHPNVFASLDRDHIFEASEYLAGIVWDSIGEVVISAREVMSWLRKAASLAAKEGLPVTWTSPSGFPVQQSYREFKSRRIETKLSGNLLRDNYRQTIRLTLIEPTDKIDKRRQANGISPNFVHSMDAACLHMYVCRAHELGVENFSLVHDSYGTVAADTEVSAQCIRDVFVEMYQQDVLSTFRTELLPQLSQDSARKLPLIPPKGKLNLEAIKQSTFFFA
jgi:DNA-directed RNA polymerase